MKKTNIDCALGEFKSNNDVHVTLYMRWIVAVPMNAAAVAQRCLFNRFSLPKILNEP